MAFVSFDLVQKILKDCEGKTFLEAMDSYDWQKGFVGIGPLQVYEAAPETKALSAKIRADVEHACDLARKMTEQERMWNLVVLAARSSRYEE